MNCNLPKISIVDYGVGNLYSLSKAFNKFKARTIITEEVKDIMDSDAIVLPGVGSFGAGMDGLKVRKLESSIKKFAESGKPVMGICLGAQLMLSKGYELGNFNGLGIIPGKVIKLSKLVGRSKIPHIGWNRISFKKEASKNTPFQSINDKDYVYFVHSFVLEPEDRKVTFATTEYGGAKFPSIIKKGNIYGCQFHPEKSGLVGLKIIGDFVNIVLNKHHV